MAEACEMVLRYHTEYHIIETLGHAHLQIRVVGGHPLGSHIMTGQGALSCMVVKLLHSLVSSLAILEREGIDRVGVPCPRRCPGMLGRSVSPPFFLRAGIDLVRPRTTIPCSSCLHGSGSIRPCSLSSDTLFARCTGTGCGGLHLFLRECLSLTGGICGLIGGGILARSRHMLSWPFLATELHGSSYPA